VLCTLRVCADVLCAGRAARLLRFCGAHQCTSYVVVSLRGAMRCGRHARNAPRGVFRPHVENITGVVSLGCATSWPVSDPFV
jgi:hypothetical protein